MFKSFKSFKKLLFTLVISSVFIPTLVFASDIASLAANLLGPTTIVTQLLVYACYIVGVVFCFMAIAQYKVHRESPKLVPLSTPVMLVLFGLLLVFLPYISTLFNSGSALEYSKKEGLFNDEHKGLALPPLEHAPRRGLGDFSGKRAQEPDSSKSRAAPVNPAVAPEGGAHWGDDPKYN